MTILEPTELRDFITDTSPRKKIDRFDYASDESTHTYTHLGPAVRASSGLFVGEVYGSSSSKTSTCSVAASDS